MLLGGVTGKDVADYHDWEFILRKLGLLTMDHVQAQAARFVGIGLMTTAIGWTALHLWMQFKAWRVGSRP